MNEGDVALAPLPQANGLTKPRPLVDLRKMPPFGDWLVCGVSSQLRQQVAALDERIEPNDPDFVGSGLKAPSVIRLAFLAVLPQSRFLGVIGSIAADRHRRLLQNLSDYLRP